MAKMTDSQFKLEFKLSTNTHEVCISISRKKNKLILWLIKQRHADTILINKLYQQNTEKLQTLAQRLACGNRPVQAQSRN